MCERCDIKDKHFEMIFKLSEKCRFEREKIPHTCEKAPATINEMIPIRDDSSGNPTFHTQYKSELIDDHSTILSD